MDHMKLVNPTNDELNAAFAEKVCGFSVPIIWYDWADREKREHPRRGYVKAPARQKDVWWSQEYGTCVGEDGNKLTLHPYHLPKNFIVSANAVLPYLKDCACTIKRLLGDEGFPETWCVEVYNGVTEGAGRDDGSLAKAATLAILRAHGVEIEFTHAPTS